MKVRRSRSTSVREDEELRLPRSPGVLRRFWARHPVVADVLIALVCLSLSLLPATNMESSLPEPFAQILAVLLPAGVVIASVSLLWRRHVPLLPFVAAFTVEACFLFLVPPAGTPTILVASYALAVYGSTAIAWRCFAIALAGLTMLTGLLTLTGVTTLQVGANAVVSALVLGLIGTLIGVNVGGRKRYIAAVIDRSRQLLVERDQQAQLAAANERARIAREMHDIVSHSLTVIVALSEGAAATADHEQARAASTATADTARSALTEMRAMLGVLRADDSQALPLAPLTAASPHETVANAQRAGYPVTLAITDAADLPPASAHALARLVQEGVTNAMRHAPDATSISVGITHTPAAVVVEIVNDGVAESRGIPGFGLRGLTERVAHVHGSIEYGPGGRGRWMLRATLPNETNTTETDA